MARAGQWRATSIAGNDITSSCLYVAGIATMAGGKFAPISLLIVALVLYLFRGMRRWLSCALVVLPQRHPSIDDGHILLTADRARGNRRVHGGG